MRVLWLSNKLLAGVDNGTTGTWLDAMADGLTDANNLVLGNVTERKVSSLERYDLNKMIQWAVPFTPQRKQRLGYPTAEVIHGIKAIIDEFAPDLIHIWGLEGYWGVVASEFGENTPCLMTVQGIKGAIAQVYSGGLTWLEQMHCIGIKEILKNSTIASNAREFTSWGLVEKGVISRLKHFHLHSAWQEAYVRRYNPLSSIYYSDLPLRKEFYEAAKWNENQSQVLFCSAAYPAPFKGLHIAIRALANVQQQYPQARLKIAGIDVRRGIRQDGYIGWLLKETRRLGVESSVEWLGPLPAKDIISCLLESAVYILPTYIEGYPVSLKEALHIGVPTVASYAGGVSSLVKSEESALLFPPGDVTMCEYQVERILGDSCLAQSLSNKAREFSGEQPNLHDIVRRQIQIYESVVASR